MDQGKFPQKERFHVHCAPIFTQCHRTFLENGKTAVSRKSLKRVIRALENLLLTSLCILSHLPPYFPSAPPTPVFGSVQPCIRVYIRGRQQPLSEYSIQPSERGQRRKRRQLKRKGRQNTRCLMLKFAGCNEGRGGIKRRGATCQTSHSSAYAFPCSFDTCRSTCRGFQGLDFTVTFKGIRSVSFSTSEAATEN